FLLGADIIVRMTAAGPELQLGLLTALVGSPVFFHRVLRLRKDGV
ncbi:MAG: iron ABC transporter permease, partial [Acetobacter persici]